MVDTTLFACIECELYVDIPLTTCPICGGQMKQLVSHTITAADIANNSIAPTPKLKNILGWRILRNEFSDLF